MVKIYVGNLPYSINDSKLESIFAEFGEIVSARVITDKHSGRSKGFGFVEFEAEDAGEAAIEELNGKEVDGRSIVVNKARPQEEGARKFGGGRGDRGDRRGPRRDSRDGNRNNGNRY